MFGEIQTVLEIAVFFVYGIGVVLLLLLQVWLIGHIKRFIPKFCCLLMRQERSGELLLYLNGRIIVVNNRNVLACIVRVITII